MCRYHAAKLARLAGVDLTAVVDADLSRASALTSKLGGAPYSDYRQVFGKADAAVGAGPTHPHHEIARPRLQHRLHLLIEKPIATTPPPTHELIPPPGARQPLPQAGPVERHKPPP